MKVKLNLTIGIEASTLAFGRDYLDATHELQRILVDVVKLVSVAHNRDYIICPLKDTHGKDVGDVDLYFEVTP